MDYTHSSVKNSASECCSLFVLRGSTYWWWLVIRAWKLVYYEVYSSNLWLEMPKNSSLNFMLSCPWSSVLLECMLVWVCSNLCNAPGKKKCRRSVKDFCLLMFLLSDILHPFHLVINLSFVLKMDGVYLSLSLYFANPSELEVFFLKN